MNTGKDYNTTSDVAAPKVTTAMMVHAVRVLCGLAIDAADAKHLIDALGFPREILMEAKRDA